MKQYKWISARCLTVMFSMVVGLAWSAPQDQRQKPPYTPAEYKAYEAARYEEHPQTKIRLLDDFVLNYSGSTLLPYAYLDYSRAYFVSGNYPKALEYADKFLALGNDLDTQSLPQGMFGWLQRLDGLYDRAQVYFAGCSNGAFQTPEAYIKARDAGNQGLQALSQWEKPDNMADEQFAFIKRQIGLRFRVVVEIADAGLKGGNPGDVCRTASAPDPDKFDRIMNDLNTQERQSPNVR